MDSGATVKTVMTKHPVTIGPEKNLTDAAELMFKEAVGSLVVVDSDKLVGILTEKDIVRELGMKSKDPTDTRVDEAMSRKVVTTDQDTDLNSAAKTMNDRNIRRLPVVDKDEKLVGVLTQKDILIIQPAMLDTMAERMRIRGPQAGPPTGREGWQPGMCENCGNYSSMLKDSNGSMVCAECADK